MWRDLAIALSLSNLCFIGPWRQLLIPSHSFYYYHVKVPPPAADYIALVLDVLLLGALFFISARIARRSGNDVMRRGARVAFVIALSLALYGLLSQADSLEVRRLVRPLVKNDVMLQRLLFTVPVTLTLFTASVALLKLSKAVRIGVVALLILAPFVAITFSQAGIIAMKYGRTGQGWTAAPVARPQERNSLRVLWLVFDELDFRAAFSERPSTVKLEELDRLAAQSLFASNAFPPARETFLTFPALTTGKLVSAARRAGPEELMIRFGDDAEAVPWTAQPNVFSRARELGFDTAIVGWYHPYCRILGSSLTKCFWLGQGDLSTIKDEPDQPNSLVFAVASRMYDHASDVVRKAPFIDRVFSEKEDDAEVVRRKQVLHYNIIRERTLEAATDPAIGLVMAHWSIPHFPNIYDRSEGTVSAAPGRSYFDNLELVDRTIGDLRRVMESKDVWENTVVLITSDHWWRSDEWKRLPGWTAEDEAALRAETDRRIPFILKMAGEEIGIGYTEPFNTVLSHDLLLAILRGEVSDVKEAAAWLDRHRSFGRSPYDERSFRDSL